tara:strand:+ start:6079 stop:6474 length:396 start_codon:yes stop_codon:yes gene_type:complete
MITIGQLDRKVLIQHKDISRDAIGGNTVEWVDLGDDGLMLSSFIEFKSGKETDGSERLNEKEVVIFYIRNIGGDIKKINAYEYRIAYPVTASAVITATTEFYYVSAVQEYEGRNRFLKILTEKRTSELTRL